MDYSTMHRFWKQKTSASYNLANEGSTRKKDASGINRFVVF